MENGSRIATFDIAKAVVLLMVVGGHLVGNGIVANCNEWCDPYFANFKKDNRPDNWLPLASGGIWGNFWICHWSDRNKAFVEDFVISSCTSSVWRMVLVNAGHHIFGLCGFSAVRSDRQTTLDSFVVLLCGAFLYAAQSAVSLVVKCIPHVPIFRVRYVCFTPL